MIDQSAPFCEQPSVWRREGTSEDTRLSTPASGRRMWLITFTDLVSLMLAFFVMLFAMSGVKVELWDATAHSLSRTLDPSRPPPPPPPVAARNVPSVVRAPALDLDYLAALFGRVSRGAPELVETKLAHVPDGLILVLSPVEVFGGDGVALSPAAAKTLSAVGGILGNFSNRIAVRLRADPAVTLQPGYRSSWELALVRAAVVANAIREAGYDRDIVAYGLTDGSSQASGDPTGEIEDERIEQIEILILAESPGHS